VPQETDHCHIYWEPDPEGLNPSGRLVTLACFGEDCYQGVSRDRYPPEKIGPKLVVRKEHKSYDREQT
jgi:hypothetical protein